MQINTLPSSFLLLSFVDLIRSQNGPVGQSVECGPRGADRTYSASLATAGTG